MLVIGHRGAAGKAFENTLDSIQAALQIGVDVIELDVQLTADGVPLLFHDKRLNRKTNATGRIATFSFDTIAAKVTTLDGQTLPSLDEACSLVAAANKSLYVELKSTGGVQQVVETLKAYSFDRLYIASFHHRLLAEVKALDRRLTTVAICEEKLREPTEQYMKKIEADVISISHDIFSLRQFAELRASGYPVFVWTINQRSTIRKFIEMGVDGIISDFPDRVIELLEEE